MQKVQLIDRICQESGMPRVDAKQAVEITMKVISETLTKGGSVYLRGFGTFTKKLRKEKIGRNIKANSQITIPAHYIPHFIPGHELKESVKAIPVK
jgi:nucleoid DNA-binding protein